MTLTTKITTSIATVALLGSLFSQAAFADDLTITGNGKKSENKIEVTKNCTTTVVQGNETEIVNEVTSKANSGGNTANENSGNVTINAGAATSNVNITNNGSSNDATVNPCCCDEQNGTIIAEISKNHKKSRNTIKDTSTNSLTTVQQNATGILNGVLSKAKSGKNKANGNLGGGTVNITTHTASSGVGITNNSGTNTLN